MKKHKLMTEVMERHGRGETEIEIAMGLGVSVASVRNWLGEKGVKVKTMTEKKNEEAQDLIRQWVGEGATIREMCERMGKPYAYVWGQLKRLNLKAKRVYTLSSEQIEKQTIAKEMREGGKTLQEIGEHLGVTKEAVRLKLKKQGLVGTWERNEKERALFIEENGDRVLLGLSRGERLMSMAKELGVGYYFLSKVLEDMGCKEMPELLMRARNEEMREKRERGATVASLVREYGLCEGRIRTILSEEGRK